MRSRINVIPYLDKIGLKIQKPSLAYLNDIIEAHQKTISFNNIAVYFHPGRILNLELDELIDKVIIRGEGGYCFENNKVFYYLLQNLGFEVESKAARVIYDRSGDVPRTHRTTVVTIEEKKYLVDVGFGKDAPPYAVPFGEEKSEGYQVIIKGETYFHQLVKKDSVVNLFQFDDATFLESDFTIANYYTNTHPHSKFVRELIVVRKDQSVIEFINGRTFSRIHGGKREDIVITNQQDFDIYLKKFGINQSYDFNRLPLP